MILLKVYVVQVYKHMFFVSLLVYNTIQNLNNRYLQIEYHTLQEKKQNWIPINTP